MNTTLTRKEFISALQRDTTLYAHVILSHDNGLTLKQSKTEWIKRVKASDCDAWDVVIHFNSIFVG
jgi:hypothetical protein